MKLLSAKSGLHSEFHCSVISDLVAGACYFLGNVEAVVVGSCCVVTYSKVCVRKVD